MDEILKSIEMLKKSNLTLASAESFTGGLFASTITSFSGVSSFFKGSIVTYWTEVKENILKVPSEIVDKFGVVSKECAYSMAEKALELFGVDIAVSFTGNAGPSTMENKPCGLIYIGIAFKNNINTYELKLDLPRNDIRNYAVSFALKKILQILENN